MMRPAAGADHLPGQRVGGDLAAGADGAAVRAGHGRARDRQGGLHQRGPGAGCDPQLQRGQLRTLLGSCIADLLSDGHGSHGRDA